MYTVELKPKAKKFIKGQDKKVQQQIIERLESLSNDPRPNNCKLLHSNEKLYRIRSGDYRIIYKIDDEKKLVTIDWIRHRKDAYRNI